MPLASDVQGHSHQSRTFHRTTVGWVNELLGILCDTTSDHSLKTGFRNIASVRVLSQRDEVADVCVRDQIIDIHSSVSNTFSEQFLFSQILILEEVRVGYDLTVTFDSVENSINLGFIAIIDGL